MKTKYIYYSVHNGGDGSAYPYFYESYELCEWDQEHMDEGWGENCSGTIELAEKVEVITDITTKEQYLLDLIFEYDPDEKLIKEFIEDFFPKGIPKFTIAESKKKINKDSKKEYKYVDVLLKKKKIQDIFMKITDENILKTIKRFDCK